MKTSKIRQIELSLIKSDVNFYFDLVSNLSSIKSSSVLIFGLIPYISLFTVETYKYIKNSYPIVANSLFQKHQEIITASRMRTKFFDDTDKRIDGTFELLNWLLRFNEEWHINKHKGLLAPLQRALQKDLGIFFYNGHIIGSTHTGLFNMGYEETDLPVKSSEISQVLDSLSKSIGEGLGEYLGQLSNYSDFFSSNFENFFLYNIHDNELKYKDEKSQHYFATIFNGSQTVDLNFSLFLFLTSINFNRYISKNLVKATSITLFKSKFITLYHFASSLEKLQNYFYTKNILTTASKEYFQHILSNTDLKLIKSKKKFRNILVHYKINEIPENILNPSVSLYGLVEFFFDGKTFHDIDKMLDSQIERISVLLEEWINWNPAASQLHNW